jgi:DNA-binding MarR family transcriptional regulator
MSRPTVLYHLIKEIFLVLDDGDRHLLTAYGLTVPRYYAMYHLRKHPGLSISELSELMVCDKSNATRLVQAMESDGLIVRRRHDTDGRIWLLFLTARGEALYEEVTTAHREQNHHRFAACLENGEGDVLLGALQELRHSLKQELQLRT